MFLNKIAQKNMYEKFEVWDRVSQTFSRRGFEGRIHLTDRFLSIYNRPLRKRQLFVRPGTRLPESLVFRHPASGAVYILGKGRQDAASNVDEGRTYVDMYMCHEVTPEENSSAGIARVFRKTVQGPANDPGWLVEEELEPVHIDMEFRTSATDADTYDHKIESLFCWAPLWFQAQEWDFLELWGVRYRVVDVYSEGGMRTLRIDKEVDVRVDFVISKIESSFDPVTKQWVETTEDYNVTGIIADSNELSNWRGVFREDLPTSQSTVVIEFAHIGFKPSIGMKLTIGGRSKLVKEVYTQAGEKEYRLVVE